MAETELGAFLRAHREAVSPAEVGLPNGNRRRTPGLRRAELATLAGVSVDYLTRLEQGRDRSPSAQVLTALSDTLGLSRDERIHLHRLAKATGGGACDGTAAARPLTVRPTVRALLDRLEPAPALVVNRPGDLLAWTEGFARLAGPAGLLEVPLPNLVRYVFTDPRALDVHPDWEAVAGERTAALRAAAALGDPHAALLAEELTITVGARFRDRFEGSAALPARTGVERWAHPEAGELRLAYESLELPDSDERRLVVYLASDEATATALDRLTAA
ncbi:helix-turn-helix transcriptional regulator [Nonomuraea sp. NPDC050404]|uniref:helix-turn-helix transcriptional regulator n=1 Tax=Nonomuraea sp. NPDC050404 TaxID=3155783 RepID=UPI0033FBFE9F